MNSVDEDGTTSTKVKCTYLSTPAFSIFIMPWMFSQNESFFHDENLCMGLNFSQIAPQIASDVPHV